MKPFLFLLVAASPAWAQAPALDLTAPANYARQAIPPYIRKDNTPPDNRITDLGATLGRVLFHDKRLSRTGTVSCSTCHQQEKGFTDSAVASIGVAGSTGRHSMRLIDARFANEARFFWDERATSAEDQATQPIQNHQEMGFSGADGDPGFSDLVTRLSAIEVYRVLFRGVYSDPEITQNRVGKSLAQFVRSLQSFDSRYDAGRAQVANDGPPFPNFTPAENAGKQIFLRPPNQGGAGCAACHQPPEFDIEPSSGNNGVTGSLGGGSDFTNTRAPSLRDLVDSAGVPHGPFMHDASLVSLAAVIEHYNAIPAIVPGLDNRLRGPGGQPQRLNLSPVDKADLAAFLRTLTGTAIYTDPRYSNPFGPDGSLALVVLPSQATISLETGIGGPAMVIRAAAVPNVTYQFQSSADMKSWTSASVTATPEGALEMTDPMTAGEPRKFNRFAYQAEP